MCSIAWYYLDWREQGRPGLPGRHHLSMRLVRSGCLPSGAGLEDPLLRAARPSLFVPMQPPGRPKGRAWAAVEALPPMLREPAAPPCFTLAYEEGHHLQGGRVPAPRRSGHRAETRWLGGIPAVACPFCPSIYSPPTSSPEVPPPSLQISQSPHLTHFVPPQPSTPFRFSPSPNHISGLSWPGHNHFSGSLMS